MSLPLQIEVNIDNSLRNINIDITIETSTIKIQLLDKLIRYICIMSLNELKFIEVLTDNYENINNYVTILNDLINTNKYSCTFEHETNEYILIFDINIYKIKFKHRFVCLLNEDETHLREEIIILKTRINEQENEINNLKQLLSEQMTTITSKFNNEISILRNQLLYFKDNYLFSDEFKDEATNKYPNRYIKILYFHRDIPHKKSYQFEYYILHLLFNDNPKNVLYPLIYCRDFVQLSGDIQDIISKMYNNNVTNCTKNSTTYEIYINCEKIPMLYLFESEQFDKYRHRIYEQYNNKDIYYYV